MIHFPYKLTHRCKNLKESTVSTRALFGNPKNHKLFPYLLHAPVRYQGDLVYCSECQKPMSYEVTKQVWINLWVGTDHLPLLANICSKACEDKLNNMPKPTANYLQHTHQGGQDQLLSKSMGKNPLESRTI